MLESKIQSQIIKEAKKMGYIAFKTIKCNISGWPDITLYKNGKSIFIEVKTEIGIQSPLQAYCEKIINYNGFSYYLVRSLQEFQQIIK